MARIALLPSRELTVQKIRRPHARECDARPVARQLGAPQTGATPCPICFQKRALLLDREPAF
jgi:hypothetical protein